LTAASPRQRLGRALRTPACVGVVVLAVTLLAGASLPFLRFDGRIDAMLPDRSELRDVFAFLREIEVADKIVVTFAMRDGSADPCVLAAAADRFQERLDPALAVPLRTAFEPGAVADGFRRLARQMPGYLDASDLARLEADTSPDGIRRALEALRRKVQQPEGLFAASAARADPLDWTGRTVQKIAAAVAAFGYRAVPVEGHLMDPERRHLLLVLSTPVGMMDTRGVRRLLAHLGTLTADLPAAVEARLVCGHLHTAGNEAVIRRDITLTSVAVTVVFALLFLGVYRDGRAGFVVLIPFAASVPALALAAAVFDSFSYMVVGFGSVIAGIAIDYGIHTYVAVRGGGGDRALRLLLRPVALSMLTTLCVFVAFCFSAIPAYRQLGAFASGAILLSLIYAFWALPHAVKPAPFPLFRGRDARAAAFTPSRGAARRVAAGGAALLLAGVWLTARLRFEADVAKLDGTPQATLDEEARAAAVWGGGESRAAILAVEAPDAATALRLNDRVYDGLLAAGVAPAAISSLTPVSPSDETRRARRRAWSAYWTDARSRAFRDDLARVAADLDFSDQAFASFWTLFDHWRRTPAADAADDAPPGFFEPLRERFLHTRDGVARVVTFIPDEPRALAAARQVQQAIPALRVISRTAFSQALSTAFSSEVLRVSLLAAALIALVTVATIRHAGMVLLSAVPAVTGVIWGGGAMALLGLPLNVSNLVAGIIVLGLCIDYGICMVYARARGMSRDVFRAVTLSAATTVLGAAALLLARHPAFFSIGVTLVAGVAAGYLAAALLLPALQTLWPCLGLPPAGEEKAE